MRLTNGITCCIKGFRIPFNPTRQSPDTTKIAGTQDDTNVVSWKSGLPWATLAQAYQWHVSGTNNKEFAEVDIGFNYQRTFTYHANLGQFPNAYCLLAVATHEFGHFAGLGDAKAQHNCPTQYIRYTMWANQAVGTGGCPVESLECEDKWACGIPIQLSILMRMIDIHQGEDALRKQNTLSTRLFSGK